MQDLRGTRVLLIDDQPDFLNLLKHFFRQEGAQVFTAADGESGLRQLHAARRRIGMRQLRG